MEEIKNNDINNDSFMTRGCCNPMKDTDGCNVNTSHRCSKLDSYNWLKNIEQPQSYKAFDCIEVRFKNSRKEFFKISDNTEYNEGDIVAVEGVPGHDIGIVALTGEVTRLQMLKKNVNPDIDSLKKVYRKAKVTDIEKWVLAVENEEKTMAKAKKIASEQNLNLKLNDVEYQGDNTKAIFYYTAEDRVDFRTLIKILAEEFKVRIEMRQIGVRQEASRLGGIGVCGRELCCSSWLTTFKSVSTNAARVQQLSMNPQKLAGQCSKLKCCLNFENDSYVDALKEFPSTDIPLKTAKGEGVFNKLDVYKRTIWYTYANDYSNFYEIPLDKVKEILEKNKKGEKVSSLDDYTIKKETKKDFENFIGQDDLTRFD
ncbi:MAG: regulatory iron-sulfur-containing complex subunit RicT [Bacteroidetes bacterium]|nr:regulatory iron-sulfur-containing complex subunit RicT [Bacteroidota bacterium]